MAFISPLLTFVQNSCSYDPTKELVPFVAEGSLVGWLKADFAQLLDNWPNIFTVRPRGVTLAPNLKDPAERTQRIGEVVEELGSQGVIKGWRNELLIVADSLYSEPLFFLERAAARHFGILVYASHATGHSVRDHIPVVWLARRAKTKDIDPGKLDNMVGGRISRGYSPSETLIKEAWEEAGLDAEAAKHARAAGAIRVCRPVAEGVHREIIFVHDLYVTPEFRPSNQDGEVERFYCVTPEDALARVELMTTGGDFTVEAALVMLNFLIRRGFFSPDRPDYVEILRAMKP